MPGLPPTLTRWALVACWVPLPVLAGPAVAAWLDPASSGFRPAASAVAWVVWVVVATATLVPRTTTLTAVRIAVPAAAGALVIAAVAGDGPAWSEAAGIAAALGATVAAFAPDTGGVFVNGSAYGDERRFPLRPPGPLLLGPIEATWAAAVIGAATGPVLLGRGAWAGGMVAIVIGWPAAALAIRALHGLARRWAVFTQAGIVVVDPLVLTDSLLARRQVLASLGPAPADAEGADLTAGALGLALALHFREPQPLTRRPPGRRGGPAETTEAVVVLFTPSRPGALLAEARARRLPIG